MWMEAEEGAAQGCSQPCVLTDREAEPGTSPSWAFLPSDKSPKIALASPDDRGILDENVIDETLRPALQILRQIIFLICTRL